LPTGRGCLRLRRLGRRNPGGGRISAAESIGRASRLERAPSECADETRALFETHSRQIFAFCFSRLGSREEAEDAVQSTFLNAHRALQRGVSPDSELAWLLKIAHNVCLTRRRSTRRRGRVEAAHDLESMQDYLPAPQRESPDELIQLSDALDGLPETQRRAIVLREWRGLSYVEIARELKLTQSAVETLIFRARRSLAANLDAMAVKPRLLARVRHAIELGWLLPALRSLFEGGVAVKAATAAVAVSSVAVVATTTDAPTPRPLAKATSAPVVAAASAPAATIVARPRLRERSDPTSTLSATTAARRKPKPAAPNASATAPSDKTKVKAEKTRPLRTHAPKAKPERAAKAKVAKAKRVSPTARKKPKPTPKAKAPKPAHTTLPNPKPQKAASPPTAKPVAAEQKPEPGNGKTK
jgi:RNA polymerase sigma-70 factor (ECF subfamily)